MQLITTLLRKGTIPHALLFTGIEGVGKRSTALAFAMALNCLAPEPEHARKNETHLYTTQHQPAATNACGQCRSCRKIQTGNHPDIICIAPSGPFITIGQIRDLGHTLALKPFEARLRVVVVEDCQTMNPSAGNAFLKILEEPPQRTVLILTAGHTSDLLPTIVSRCQHIRFGPIPREDIAEMLIAKKGMPPDEAGIIATLANGSFANALKVAGSKNRRNWISRRNWLLNEIDALTSRPVGLLLALAAKLSQKKDMLPELLEIIKSYLRDIVICKYDPAKIVNTDLKNKIQSASQEMTVTSLLSKIKDIQTAQRNIQANANLRLTLEVLVMRLAKNRP